MFTWIVYTVLSCYNVASYRALCSTHAKHPSWVFFLPFFQCLACGVAPSTQRLARACFNYGFIIGIGNTEQHETFHACTLIRQRLYRLIFLPSPMYSAVKAALYLANGNFWGGMKQQKMDILTSLGGISKPRM